MDTFDRLSHQAAERIGELATLALATEFLPDPFDATTLTHDEREMMRHANLVIAKRLALACRLFIERDHALPLDVFDHWATSVLRSACPELERNCPTKFVRDATMLAFRLRDSVDDLSHETSGYGSAEDILGWLRRVHVLT